MLQTLNIELSEFIQKYKPYLLIITNKEGKTISVVGWIEGETYNYPLQAQLPENSKEIIEIIEKVGYTLINVQHHDSLKILMYKR